MVIGRWGNCCGVVVWVEVWDDDFVIGVVYVLVG